MIDKKVEQLEEKLGCLEGDIVDSKQALSNISKDIHIMSQTSVRMENALTKLLETEVKFQLHAQKTEQNHLDHAHLIKNLFKRVEASELILKTVDADHKVVEKISGLFWNVVGWTAVIIGGAFVSVLIYVANNGGFKN